MKVLMIEMLGDGGIAHYTFNLLNALRKRGLEASLCTRAQNELSGEECKYEVYPLMFRGTVKLIENLPWLDVERPIPSFLRRAFKLVEYPWNIVAVLRLIKRKGITVTHLQSVNWVEVAMISALKLTGNRVVYTIHNVSPLHGRVRWYHKVIIRFAYRICDRLIIHTEEGKNRIVRLFRVEPGKVSVIPHGDYTFFVPAERIGGEEAKERLLGDKELHTILFFGAIRRNKGLEQALHALAHVKRKVTNVRLMVVGELCEKWKRYGEIIEREGLEDYVFQHLQYVPKEDVGLFFEAADVVILPYYEITESGVLQVAFAFSKPVVAADIAGFRERIEEGKNGYLVPIGNYRLWGEKIAGLLEDEETRMKMGNYSRRVVQERFSWDKIAVETERVYRSVL